MFFGPDPINNTNVSLSENQLGILLGIFDFEPDLGLKLGQNKPKISGTVPTHRHTTIPNDSGPISACFDDGPKLVNCEIAQPKPIGTDITGPAPSFH